MAWELKKVEEQRIELIEEYLKESDSIAELARRFGISRKTAHKWINRSMKEGDESMKDLSKAPKNPHRKYPKSQIQEIIELKMKRRKWGPKKILARLKTLHPESNWPSERWVYDIFKKLDLTTPKRIRARVPATQPLGNVTGCNDTWTIDFKGWFTCGDGAICEPLTIMDAESRFLIDCVHMPKKTANDVWRILVEAFNKYGIPNRIRSDNGPPFACKGAGRLTKLSVNCIKAGITPEWITPGHPEENGRHERFHLTLKDEVASPPAKTLREQIKRINQLIEEYNCERPHEALDMRAPIEVYTRSNRKWKGETEHPVYDDSFAYIRKVCPNGCIWIKKTNYYIGQSVKGEYLGVKVGEDDKLEAYYGPIYLGVLTSKLIKPERKKRQSRKRGG